MSNTPKEYLIDDADLLVLMGNQAGIILYANPAYLKASGYEWSELKGTQSAKMMHKDNPPQVMKDMVVTIGGKQPWTGLIKNRRKNGDYYWLRLNISPVFSQGKYAGSLMVHSKPSREEVAHIEPLYKLMLDGNHKKLMLRNGRAFTANAWGKTLLWMRELGLKGRIWSAMAALNVVGITGLLSTNSSLGDASFWVASASLMGLTGAIGAYLYRSIVLPLRQAARFANQIAAGDLGSQMLSHRSDEIGTLIRALAQMNVNMRATVLDVRDGAGLMKRATEEIATGTLDLSSRTESQASNLEETAASMEQMNVTVRNNSETARQASQVAAEACVAAETGGKAVGEMIATMDVITKSSKQISEIIGVIDSIAFQTNILALNAAVEAARAGEQGRGFAVVAAEVRSLAQRSAQSAKEIRALISQSVDTVDGGSKLVNSAGKKIEDVVTQVRRVTELVNHIAGASSEQSTGIGQINQAVVTLDHMTQQNAALVEQSTASAESLREQAVRMVDVVSVFKLSQK
ncbi:MAG TPA: methyl-accepting chemotaxis protein [Rhizobacter sp.]|nr:methyl-accepting chemotaxis protein [Rhizobacter sp.]